MGIRSQAPASARKSPTKPDRFRAHGAPSATLGYELMGCPSRLVSGKAAMMISACSALRPIGLMVRAERGVLAG